MMLSLMEILVIMPIYFRNLSTQEVFPVKLGQLETSLRLRNINFLLKALMSKPFLGGVEVKEIFLAVN